MINIIVSVFQEWQPFPKRWYNEGLLVTNTILKDDGAVSKPTLIAYNFISKIGETMNRLFCACVGQICLWIYMHFSESR